MVKITWKQKPSELVHLFYLMDHVQLDNGVGKVIFMLAKCGQRVSVRG